jgi:hypothetical protein
MKRIIALILFLLTMTSCAPVADSASSSAPEPATVKHTYVPSSAPILNPERGFFTPYELPGPVGFSPVRLTGNSLVHLNIRLDDWRETDLPADFLASLNQNFADLREAGLKAIIRFAYNQGPWPDSEPDASKAQILRHIEQLKPFFEKNSDVIAWVEAGFIGAWGEWHTSTNGLDNLTDKQEILNSLLAAIPGRYVQVRYPANILEMYPTPADAATARVAHHNDCFLSSDTDVGTYERDGVNTIVRDQQYLAELTSLTPMSGETCAPNPPRSECNSAIREMELLHFSAVNEAYHKGILRSWEQGGCLEEITNRLGYRLTLIDATFNEQVQPGGLLNLRVSLENSGFAAPVNPRPIFIVLQQNKSIFLTTLDPLDPRSFQPGSAAFTAKLRVPSGMAEGNYNLALWLPDPAATLQSNPLYAIRFANEAIWDETTGYNILGQVNISHLAGGSAEKTDFLTVLEMVGGPVAPLPTSTAAPTATPEPLELISNIQVSSNAETLNLQFTFSGALENYNALQAFLDVDQNPATGFALNGLGADFLLENGTLNAYTGSGSDWAWNPLDAQVTFSSENQTAIWNLPHAALGDAAAMDIIFQLVDTNWDTAFVTGKQTYPLK